MNEYLGLDVGQANELKLAFRRYDWNNELIKKLCESDILGDALSILRGDMEVTPVKRVLDMNASPSLKDDHRIVRHVKGGKKEWSKIRLALLDPYDLHYEHPRAPLRRKSMVGLDKRHLVPRFLLGQKHANMNLRDFFLKNQHLIPRRWEYVSEPILFWGTLLDKVGYLSVPGMWRPSGFNKWQNYDRRVDRPGTISLDEYNNPAVVFV